MNDIQRIWDDAVEITARQVAESYLKDEFNGLFRGLTDSFDYSILQDDQLWQLVEAMSFTYRRNWIFFEVSEAHTRWKCVDVPMDSIILTGMTPAIDEIACGPNVERSPMKMAQYLRSYFAEHPTDDPLGLWECRPKPYASDAILYGIYDGQGVKMLDGSHRLLSMAQQGVATVRMYVGRRPQGVERRHMVGAAVILFLRKIYAESESDIVHESVAQIVEYLVGASVDGGRAVQEYWVKYERRPKELNNWHQAHGAQDVSALGQAIIDRMQSRH